MYQNWPSNLHQLPFDQGVQIVIPPRSPASVLLELIGTPTDSICIDSNDLALLFITSINKISASLCFESKDKLSVSSRLSTNDVIKQIAQFRR